MNDKKLVFLDAGSIGSDFAWPDYACFGQVLRHDSTLPEQTEERIKDATFILTKKSVISAGHIAAAKKLRFIGALGTGFNHVDIGAAASREPMADSNPLRFAKNCIITPHVAWCSLESRKLLMERVYGNIKAYLDGAPVNVVNGI